MLVVGSCRQSDHYSTGDGHSTYELPRLAYGEVFERCALAAYCFPGTRYAREGAVGPWNQVRTIQIYLTWFYRPPSAQGFKPHATYVIATRLSLASYNLGTPCPRTRFVRRRSNALVCMDRDLPKRHRGPTLGSV